MFGELCCDRAFSNTTGAGKNPSVVPPALIACFHKQIYCTSLTINIFHARIVPWANTNHSGGTRGISTTRIKARQERYKECYSTILDRGIGELPTHESATNNKTTTHSMVATRNNRNSCDSWFLCWFKTITSTNNHVTLHFLCHNAPSRRSIFCSIQHKTDRYCHCYTFFVYCKSESPPTSTTLGNHHPQRPV